MAIQMILSAIPSLFYNYYAKLITKTYHPRYRPWYTTMGFGIIRQNILKLLLTI